MGDARTGSASRRDCIEISPNTPISYPWGFSILREVMMFAEKHLNNPRPPRAKLFHIDCSCLAEFQTVFPHIGRCPRKLGCCWGRSTVVILQSALTRRPCWTVQKVQCSERRSTWAQKTAMDEKKPGPWAMAPSIEVIDESSAQLYLTRFE